MELANFLVNPKTIDFRGCAITYNADAFTPELIRKAARGFREHYIPLADTAALQDEAQEETDDDKKQRVVNGIERTAKKFEHSAADIEADHKLFASLLVGTPDHPVLMAWDLTRNGEPVPCTEEELLKLNPQIVRDLWVCVKDGELPKSQEIQETQTSQMISETTKSRSSSQETQADDAPIM